MKGRFGWFTPWLACLVEREVVDGPMCDKREEREVWLVGLLPSWVAWLRRKLLMDRYVIRENCLVSHIGWVANWVCIY